MDVSTKPQPRQLVRFAPTWPLVLCHRVCGSSPAADDWYAATQVEDGDLALVQVRADPVDERVGLRERILTRSQVLVQAAEPELLRPDRRAVRPEHPVQMAVPVAD